MSETNVHVIIGRVTRNPQMKYTPSGRAILNFDIAWNQKYTDSAGLAVSRVFYYPCVIYGRYAETMHRYLLKGKQVSVTGRGVNRRWEDKAGNWHKDYTIEVENLQLLAGGSGGSGDSKPAEDYGADYETRDDEGSGQTLYNLGHSEPAMRNAARAEVGDGGSVGSGPGFPEEEELELF